MNPRALTTFCFQDRCHKPLDYTGICVTVWPFRHPGSCLFVVRINECQPDRAVGFSWRVLPTGTTPPLNKSRTISHAGCSLLRARGWAEAQIILRSLCKHVSPYLHTNQSPSQILFARHYIPVFISASLSACDILSQSSAYLNVKPLANMICLSLIALRHLLRTHLVLKLFRFAAASTES